MSSQRKRLSFLSRVKFIDYKLNLRLNFAKIGFETSSTTMTMALYELAYRHDIQEKLRDEIEEVCRRNDGQITYESIKEMAYLDQVVNGKF